MASYKERSAFDRLNKLHWLSSRGCEFGFDVAKKIDDLRKDAPSWKPEYGDRAVDHVGGRSGFVKTDMDYARLDKSPLKEIVTKASELSGRGDDIFTEHDPFAGLCKEKPARAIGALRLASASGEFPSQFWRRLIESREENDPDRLKLLLAGRLSRLRKDQFSELSFSIGRWFKDAADFLYQKHRPLFDSIFLSLIETLQSEEPKNASSLVRQSNEIDWVTEAINSIAGWITEALIKLLASKKPKKKDGLPDPWKEKFDLILGLPGNSRQYGLVLLSHQLTWLYWLDKGWSERTLLQLLGDENRAIDAEAVWAGFFWGARMPNEPLYRRLKPHLLGIASKRNRRRRRHGEVLGGILLAGWAYEKRGKRLVSSKELHNVILDADEEFRGHLIWQLNRWSKEEEEWAKRVVPFLTEVWPRHKKARTPSISSRLVDLAIDQGDRFPEVIKTILPLLGHGDPNSISLYRLASQSSNIAETYPRDTLTLLYQILSEDASTWPYGAESLVQSLLRYDSQLHGDPQMIELLGRLELV